MTKHNRQNAVGIFFRLRQCARSRHGAIIARKIIAAAAVGLKLNVKLLKLGEALFCLHFCCAIINGDGVRLIVDIIYFKGCKY